MQSTNEQQIRRIKKLTYLRLGLLFVDEVFTLTIWAGPQFRAFRRQFLKDIYTEQRRLSYVLASLKQQGLITKSGKGEAQLTEAGRRMIKELNVQLAKPPRQIRWDQNWHVIVFDVPEDHRLGRDLLRLKLTEYGCYQLQKSVFIYPYSLKDMIERLRDAYDLRSDVHYLVVEQIDNRNDLEEHFRQKEILPESK